MNIVSEMQDTAEMAVGVATMPTFLGGIGGIAAGAVIGGILSSKLVFGGTLANTAAAGGEFLIGAAMYGVGLSGRVSNPALRSATQVTGVVIAGMGLGRLLSLVGAPTLGLGSDESDGDGRVIGQDYSGLVIGQQAETFESNGEEPEDDPMSVTIGQDYSGQVIGQQAEAYATDEGPMMEQPPAWASGATAVDSIWNQYAKAGLIDESQGHGVTEWFGSAENFVPSANRTYLGNTVSGSEGLGSVIGQ
tara:strand:+ start:5179 stop:5922 length:744 start_codon:yes stop_codon:yes gene_type:complete